MRSKTLIAAAVAAAFALAPQAPRAEILAMMNYESKTQEALRALKLPTGPGMVREEGIAVVDVDPDSPTFGRWLMDIPLPNDLVAHHIFYNQDATKAYVTALAKPELRVIDLQRFPYRVKVVDVTGCEVGEDVIFNKANTRWYLTCMGSHRVIVGDAVTDEPIRTIDMPLPYSHGIALHEGIDRMLVTSTVRHTDLGDPGDALVVLEASSGEVLDTLRVSDTPDGEAPVEILFVPDADPPVAYVTNMYGHALWAAVWDPAEQAFTAQEVIDFEPLGAGVPLEIYFNRAVDRLYVTTAKPGHLHIFDISAGALEPELVASVPTGEGAHHVAITPDERLAFVQNALLNLPGMSDGSVTVVDLQAGEAVASVDTLKERGLNPNLIVLLPQWYHPAGH